MPKEIQDVIPQALLEKAYASEGDNVEYAWQSEDAKHVADVVASADMAILGGDIWYPTDQGIRIPWDVYDWSTNRNENELWHDFVLRSQAEAKSMIDQYMNSVDLERKYGVEPHFNLCVVDEEAFDSLREGF